MHPRHLRAPSLPHRQRGAIFLVTMVIMVLGVSTLLVGSLNNSAVQTARDNRTSAALAQAKEALIGYAITYAETHTSSPQVDGYLPCPDLIGTGEGSSDTCGNQNVSSIGKLPWKTLGLRPLRDGAGECLWYAVSGSYKNNPKTEMMNWDTQGLLQVSDANGNTVSDVVAVIFAPGPPLSGQDRSASVNPPLCGDNYTASNYLDSDGTHDNSTVSGTANATSSFYSGTSDQMNDRLIYITRQDIWNAILKRSDFDLTKPTAILNMMTQKAAECLADFGKRNYFYSSGDKRLPWAGRFYNPSTDYLTDSNYDDDGNTPRRAGRLPYRVNTSDQNNINQIDSPDYQLASDGSGCPDVVDATGTPDWYKYYPWWSNWKDHLYYAVSYNFDPRSSNFYWDSEHHTWHMPHCGSCIQVNGSEYAAVVIFAGQALSGQSRATDSDRLDPANYLEGNKLTNINNYTYGSGTYTTTSSSNDVLYCINPDLSVTPC